ncbi:MAG: hypothetical protein M1817_004375 [Caeruleum heppii]|nr:MAG: hypothetical protein M1817_004375 [Caeruleum heppii]
MYHTSLLRAATAALALCAMAVEAKHRKHFTYTTVTGYFLQDDPATDPRTFKYNETSLGLINRGYDRDPISDWNRGRTQWQRFRGQVGHFNRRSGKNVQYKVLYLQRHGEGFHNVAESFYGTPAWDCYWSKLDGNGTVVWDDAEVTANGLDQARIANRFWADALVKDKIPAPESFYTSPLSRCTVTANLTWSTLDLPHRPDKFKPTVKELLREAIGIHTCDRRRNKTEIANRFPSYKFEPSFTESDQLWAYDEREIESQQQYRLTQLLDDVFQTDDRTFISMTSHSGAIGNILKVLGHRPFSLVTGATIPVLVKAEVVKQRPSTSLASSTPAPSCTTDPFPTTTP